MPHWTVRTSIAIGAFGQPLCPSASPTIVAVATALSTWFWLSLLGGRGRDRGSKSWSRGEGRSVTQLSIGAINIGFDEFSVRFSGKPAVPCIEMEGDENRGR